MLHFNLLLNRVGCCILISDEFFPRLRSGYNEEDIILPTAYFYAALAAGIAAVVVFLVLRVKYGGLNGLYSKAIASFLFLLTALSAAAVNPGHEVYAGLIVFGLVLGLSGDIWLDLKWIYEKDMEKFLNAGFIAFMIGHVFYIGAIYKFAGNWSVLTAVLPIIISVVVAIGNVIVSEKLLKLKFGKFRTIVGVYTFFLFMTFASFSTVIAVFENLIACACENFGWDRRRACVIGMTALVLLGLPCALGYNVWSFIQPLGAGSTVLDFEDFLVSNLLLPGGSLVYLLFCVTRWGWGFDGYTAECNTGDGPKMPRWVKPYFKYVLPVLIAVILVQGL